KARPRRCAPGPGGRTAFAERSARRRRDDSGRGRRPVHHGRGVEPALTTVLLDTHVVHWWSAEPARLSEPAANALAEADELAVAAGVWITITTVCPRTLSAAMRNERSCSIWSSDGLLPTSVHTPGGGAVASK